MKIRNLRRCGGTHSRRTCVKRLLGFSSAGATLSIGLTQRPLQRLGHRRLRDKSPLLGGGGRGSARGV
jgi:hypothetical protein